MLDFLEALLRDAPPLTLPVGPCERSASAERQGVLWCTRVDVYTDASCSELGYSGIGVFVEDLEPGARGWAGARVPEWVLHWLRRVRNR